MSSSIRTQLTRNRTLIKEIIAATQQIVDDGRQPENENDIDKLATTLQRLSRSIDTLTEKDRSWESYRQRLVLDGKPEIAEGEERLFDQYNGGDDGGYLEILEHGRDRQHAIKLLLDKCKEVNNDQGSAVVRTPLVGNDPPVSRRSSASSQFTTDEGPLYPNQVPDNEQARFALQPNVTSASGRQAVGGAATNRQAASVKLPKITLMRFNGDIRRYVEFIDGFKSSVHNQPIADVTKLQYLKGQLDGVAFQAVEGLAVTDQNYTTALSILETRFGNVAYTKYLLYTDLRHVTVNGNRLCNLREAVDRMERCFRQLESLGENIEQANFVSTVLEKVPSHVITELSAQRKCSAMSEWTVTELREALQQYLTVRENAQQVSNGGDSISPVDSVYRYGTTSEGNVPQTADALAVQGKTVVSGPTSPCAYCDGQHYHKLCPRYKTLDERRNRIYEKRLCYLCLKANHSAKNCRSAKRCFVCKQVGKHHESICSQNVGENRARGVFMQGGHSSRENARRTARVSTVVGRPERADIAMVADTEGSATAQKVSVCEGKTVVMHIIKARVRSPKTGNAFGVNVILDTASQRSFIADSLIRNAQLDSESKELLDMKLFMKKSYTVPTEVVTFHIILQDGSTVSIRANSSDSVLGECRSQVLLSPQDKEVVGSLPNTSHLLAKGQNSTVVPDILIGLDYFWRLVYLPGVPLPRGTPAGRELPSGLFLIPTRLGLTVGGPAPTQGNGLDSTALFVAAQHKATSVSDTPLIQPPDFACDKMQLEGFWRLEHLGIMDSATQRDDEEAQRYFDATITRKDGRFVARWPWKDNRQHQLPDNRLLAFRRFVSVIGRLKADPVLFEKYAKIMREQTKLGIIEGAPPVRPDVPLHYLPHHPVITPQKTTTKVRIVYDGSARQRKGALALNDCMHRGPVILPSLLGLLLRFRTHKVALISDVEKAFLQVSLHEDDRDATRFFWLTDDTKPTHESNVTEYRFARVAFGVIASPFLLAATILSLLKTSGSKFARFVSRNTYVDNLILGTSSEDKAVRMYHEIKELFEKGASMNVREWASSSTKVRDAIPVHDRVTGSKQKVLGIPWDAEADVIGLPQLKEKAAGRATKRSVLHDVAGVYDPLGFVTPCTILSKRFLQNLWQQEHGWDDGLSSEAQEEWDRLLAELRELHHFSIPRYLSGLVTSTKGQLVTFTDASMIAYAAVVYLRLEDSLGHVSVHFLCSRSRLAPKEKTKNKVNANMTIPRLELLGLLIGSRATKSVASELDVPVDAEWLMSDSKAALQWILTSKPLSVFVDNRVREIRSHNVRLRHVSSGDNPADLATRGVAFSNLQGTIWTQGPAWLKRDVNGWACRELSQGECLCDESMRELRRTTVCVDVAEKVQNGCQLSRIMDASRFSSLRALLKATAFVLRFIGACKRVKFDTEVGIAAAGTHGTKGVVTTMETKVALNLWDKAAQHDHFAQMADKDIKALEGQLRLLKDASGVTRCEGRFANSSETHPKYLPRECAYTVLVIRAYHERSLRSGIQHTLAELRNDYWVPQGRRMVRSVVKGCMFCRRHTCVPFRQPCFAPYPKERISASAPFLFVGLDYFGPLPVHHNGDNIKVWVCLYTCIATRAVHLELVNGLSTNDFILCFRRIISRRGRPLLVMSDNAPCFRLAKDVFDIAWARVLQSDEFGDMVREKGIEWKLATEFSPWQGGIYERLVGVVKVTLRKALNRRYVDIETMRTILAEAECVINSRPLTYVYDEPGEPKPIRPCDFLGVHLSCGLPELADERVDDRDYSMSLNTKDQVIQRWETHDKLVKRFWQIWRVDYLNMLRERTKTDHPSVKGAACREPIIGEVVLLDDSSPRCRWRRGVVVGVRRSPDGLARSVVVKTAMGQLQRPVSKLYPLEVQSETPPSKIVEPGVARERPVRMAAERARERFREQLSETSHTCCFARRSVTASTHAV